MFNCVVDWLGAIGQDDDEDKRIWLCMLLNFLEKFSETPGKELENSKNEEIL
jgi:hypothetical protein